MADDNKKLEELANLTLDHLRGIRGDVAKVQDHLREHDKRFSLIEHQLAALRRDVAVSHELIVDHGDDIRALKERIERLERHAGLTETLQQ
jgi:septal ring factor EnvC (AmiA/AmiB activator)